MKNLLKNLLKYFAAATKATTTSLPILIDNIIRSDKEIISLLEEIKRIEKIRLLKTSIDFIDKDPVNPNEIKPTYYRKSIKELEEEVNKLDLIRNHNISAFIEIKAINTIENINVLTNEFIIIFDSIFNNTINYMRRQHVYLINSFNNWLCDNENINVLTNEFIIISNIIYNYNYIARQRVHLTNEFNNWLCNTESLAQYLYSKSTDLIVYVSHWFSYSNTHVFDKTTFVEGRKHVFNKIWLADKSLPKFVEVPASSVTVPGFTVKSKYTHFVDGNVVLSKKPTIVYHKYDFWKEINNIDEEIVNTIKGLYLVDCYLWSLYNVEYINTYWKCIFAVDTALNMISKNIEDISIIIEQARDLALIPRDFKSMLLSNKLNLDIFAFDDVLFEKISGIKSIYNTLIDIKTTLTSINLDRGYILSTDLFDSNFYPIIADVIKLLIKRENYEKLNNQFKTSCYRWIINIILLNYYTVCNKILNKLSSIDLENVKMEDEHIHREITSQIKVLSNWCYSMMDNSIKQHLIKKNITIHSDVITGFDTEFVALDWNKNELLSVQLSLSHVLKLSIPIFKTFNFEGVNTLTSETYLKAVPKFDEALLMQDFITQKLYENRAYKFGKHDIIMKKIANHYNNNDNIKNLAVTSTCVNILFEKSPIKNVFILPVEGERLELNFASLIKIIANNIADLRDLKEDNLYNEIKYLNFGTINQVDSILERFEQSWNSKTMNNLEIETISLSNKENDALTGVKNKDKDKASNRRKSFNVRDDLSLIEEDLINLKDPQDLRSKSIDLKSINIDNNNNNNIINKYKALEEGELGGLETKVTINCKRKIYLAAHYNAADLTLLKDWNSVSYRNVDIAKKCYTSLSLPIKYKGGNESVYIRDTMLLVSATAKSLASVAYAYGLNKVELSTYYKENMDILLKENYELFKEYAMNDSLITLIHTLFINDFAFKIGALAIPNTLGTLSSKYIKNKWRSDAYRGYQIDVNYPLGDARVSHTPKGINFGGTTLEFSNLFIGSYRGGRNECFKYGIDKDTKWFDYDLASCYSTIMSMMGDPNYDNTAEENLAAVAENVMTIMGQPDYNKGTWINPKTDISKLDLKESYSAFRIKFCLPKEIKYPPFPVTLDQSITVYPSSGETLVTGLELMTGMKLLNQAIDKFGLSKKDYSIEILYGAYIPFKTELTPGTDGKLVEKRSYSPFYEVINELQQNRRVWKKSTGKGSAMERIYKDLGNMLYGKVICGISNKRVYDARVEDMKTMIGNDLSNPILGTWITGYVRSLIAELLFKVDLLGGDVVSCTTDGFVCNIPDLENTILSNFDNKDSLLMEYRDIRMRLSGDPEALEVKTTSKGIMQWTTRGQMSLDTTEGLIPITAATGYQKSMNHKENVDVIQKAMFNGNKILFLQKELTGSLDLYKTKNHVSMKSSQRKFRTIFDSKRFVLNSKDPMLSTRPFDDVSEAMLHRKLMMELKTTVYSDEYSVFTVPPSKNSIQETVKYFLRMVSHLHSYKIPTELKFSLGTLLNKLDKSISINYVIDILSNYESERGNVVTKLPVFRTNSEFVKDLYNEMLKIPQAWGQILDIYLVYFDNFNVLPRTPQVIKDNLLSELQNIEPERLVIERKGNEIIIKVLEE